MKLSLLSRRTLLALGLPGVLVGIFLFRQHALASKHPASTVARSTIPELIRDIDAHADPQTSPYLNSIRAALYKSKLDSAPKWLTPDEKLDQEYLYARELLNAGKTEEAIARFQEMLEQIKKWPPAAWPSARAEILMREAVAELRLGEQQNCCDRNNAASCLLPISGSGVHTRQHGSRSAIQILTEVLRFNPQDAAARWLLNIAYMTIGQYPQGMPAQWRIPLQNFGGYPMPPFYNAAPQMGLDLLGWAGSVTIEDFEGNGLLDLMISSMRVGGQLRYFHNNGDGTFTDRTREAGLIGETGGLNIITTDYNNDGKPDVIVLRGGWQNKGGHYPLSLLRNDGNGHFTDVTIQAGLLTLGPTQTAVAFDYNGDGLLDLFVGYESIPGQNGDAVPCRLFRNNGDGTFTDATTQCGLNLTRFVKAAVSADFTHSGRPGLFLSCCNQQSILLRNDGPAGADRSPAAPWKFTDVTDQAGVSGLQGSFSCFFFDYDNDGWPDLYVVGYMLDNNLADVAKDYLGLPNAGQKARLYHNNHDGTFTDVSNKAHLDKVTLGMGINYGDLDNDGWLDFYVGTGTPDLGMLVPNRMFRNHAGRYFDEVTTSGNFGHLQKGHGIAFGDLNNNGQQDIFEVMGGVYEGDTAHDCLYINPGNRNHWVTLMLEGVTSNRIALGAEICVTAETPHGRRQIYKTVSTGGSFGNNPLRQEIGLGDATAIKRVSIHWPSTGISQVITNVGMDHFYKIHEGAPTAELKILPTFPLPTGPVHASHTGAVSIRASSPRAQTSLETYARTLNR